MARYWVGGTGNTNDSSHWSLTSGGAGSAGTPGIGDDVFFDANSGSGTVTINAAMSCRSFQTAGSSITSCTHNSAVTVTVGDATLGANGIAIDLSGFSTYTLGNTTSSAWSLTSTATGVQSVNWTKPSGSVTFNGAPNGSWKYLSSHTVSASATLTLTGGSVDCAALNHSFGHLALTGSGLRSFSANGSLITLSGTGTVLNVSTTNLILNATSGNLLVSDTSASTKTLTPGTSQVWGNLTINGAPSCGSVTVNGAVQFANIAFGQDSNVLMSASQTKTCSGFSGSGASGHTFSIGSTTPGTQYTISCPTGTQASDYGVFQDFKATGGASFYAGAHSTSTSNNSGIAFQAVPTQRGLLAIFG